MRALVWHGGERLVLEDVPEPEPEDGEVLFEVALAGICGSDLHPYRGHPGPRRPPLVLGHEAVGTVTGRKGRFAVFPLVTCGECPACHRGEPNLCERRGLLGLDRQGVFAERVAVSADALVPVPEEVDDRLATLVEPLATAVSVLRQERVGGHDTVAVVGGGPIGLLTVYAAARRAARVLAVEPVAERRNLAARLGAASTFADVDQVPAAVADVAVDAVGLDVTLRGAIAAARMGARVAIVGLGQAEAALPVGDLVRRGLTLRGHYAYVRRDFEEALDLLAADPPPLDWLTVMRLEQGAAGFHRLVHDPGAVTKVLLTVG